MQQVQQHPQQFEPFTRNIMFHMHHSNFPRLLYWKQVMNNNEGLICRKQRNYPSYSHTKETKPTHPIVLQKNASRSQQMNQQRKQKDHFCFDSEGLSSRLINFESDQVAKKLRSLCLESCSPFRKRKSNERKETRVCSSLLNCQAVAFLFVSSTQPSLSATCASSSLPSEKRAAACK